MPNNTEYLNASNQEVLVHILSESLVVAWFELDFSKTNLQLNVVSNETITADSNEAVWAMYSVSNIKECLLNIILKSGKSNTLDLTIESTYELLSSKEEIINTELTQFEVVKNSDKKTAEYIILFGLQENQEFNKWVCFSKIMSSTEKSDHPSLLVFPLFSPLGEKRTSVNVDKYMLGTYSGVFNKAIYLKTKTPGSGETKSG